MWGLRGWGLVQLLLRWFSEELGHEKNGRLVGKVDGTISILALKVYLVVLDSWLNFFFFFVFFFFSFFHFHFMWRILRTTQTVHAGNVFPLMVFPLMVF